VHGDDAVEAGALSAPDQELLVVEALQVGLGQRCVDLNTLTLPGRVEAPVAPSATPPFAPFVPLVFEVWVSGERAVGGCVVPDPSVLDVGVLGGTVALIGTVLVPVGVVPVGTGGLVVVGAPVVVVPVAGGLPGVVVDGVVVDGVVVAGLPAAGSLFRLSGSITSEIGRGCRPASVVVGVGELLLDLLARSLAVFWGRCPEASPAGAGPAVPELLETAAGALADRAAWATGERDLVVTGAAFAT
jgi:hypothetical protein